MSTTVEEGTHHSDVLVVGGGIIGVCCAWELAERGLRVTLIDKRDIGYGCSYGNAGWLTPCFAQPLPMPGMFLKSLGWLLDPDGPLYIKPRLSWRLASWLMRFLRAMNEGKMQRSVAALVALSQQSLETYARIAAAGPADFGFEQKGLLSVANTPSGLDAVLEELHLMQAHGVAGRALDAAEVRALEPAVTAKGLTGGAYFPDEAHVDPLKTVEAIRDLAIARGATILPRTELVSFERAGGRITGAVTTRGRMTADRYLLATGAWSYDVARTVGLNVPVLSGKGYTLLLENVTPAPRIPILIMEKKIAVTPMPTCTKACGTLELVGVDESITERRVAAILRGSQEFLGVQAAPRIVELWRGLRPCTPDGVPIIGRSSKIENLWMATGHQMLGLQTGPATGRLVAELIAGATPAIDPAPFAAARYGD